MYDDLVKRLREHNGWALNETLDEAANAIEELSKKYLASEVDNMSGIYIKGVSIPGNCCACFAADHGGSCRITRKKPTFEEWYEQRGADCPLIPVPEHGRLIDADELIVDIMDRGIDGIQTDDWYEIQQVVMDAPTIIPESEEAGDD